LFNKKVIYILIIYSLGIGDWGLGFWGLGVGGRTPNPKPQPPTTKTTIKKN